MIGLQIVCVGIVALYVAIRSRREPGLGGLLGRLGVIGVASWVGEDSVIRAYGFYGYAAGWSVYLDRVPLLIVMIWPVVIHSAWDLAKHLVGERSRWVALVGGALVLADASLIEPIAVRAGLWSWSEPGLFGVPPIGILGWAFFAWACIALFERTSFAIVVLAPLVTHGLLLAAWWGLFRWINRTVEPWPIVAAIWGLSIALAIRAVNSRVRSRVPLGDMLARAPAAGFFFVLLGLHGSGALVAYAVAFAPPYLALISWRRKIA